MKLYGSSNSPYARKIRVIALEFGIIDRIEMIATNPHDMDTDLRKHNPLGKIPVMVLDNGDNILDSPIICEYLNAEYGEGRLLPKDSRALWKMRSQVTVADGAMDAAMLVRLEGMREPQLQSQAWMERQMANAKRALAQLETEMDDVEGELNLLAITLGCALGWLIFRFPDADWLGPNPRMAAWYQTFSERDSMVQTAPGMPL